MQPHSFILWVAAPHVHTCSFMPGLRNDLPRLIGAPITWNWFYLDRLRLAVAHHVPPGSQPPTAKIGTKYFHHNMVIIADRPSSLGDGEPFDGLTWIERNAVLRQLKLAALRFTWISPAQVNRPDGRIIFPIPYHALPPSP